MARLTKEIIMTIQINGVYEFDSVYRVYVYRKIRKYYRCLINQIGTDFIIYENVNGKWIKDNCKYIGQARSTWEDLFKIKENDNGF